VIAGSGDNGFSSQEQQLQAAIGGALNELDARWWDCVRSPHSSTAGTSGGSAFFQLGKRLGQFLIQPTLAMAAVASKLALLKESEAIRSKKRLNALDAEATTICVRQIPQIDADRDAVLAAHLGFAGEQARSGWSGSLWEIILYLSISIALFVAEFSLATQITQEALLLRNPWVFSLALACLTLAFKFLADRFFKDTGRAGLVYLALMILLFLSLMLPVAVLRTETVLVNSDELSLSSSGVPWSDGSNGSSAIGDPMPGGGAPPQRKVAQDPAGTSAVPEPSPYLSKSFYLKTTFFLSSILFPLLSGAGFSRFQNALDIWRKDNERQGGLQLNRERLSEIEKEYKTAHERLSVMAEENSQIIVTLGDTLDGVGFYVSRICDLLGAERALNDAGNALTKEARSETLGTFLTAVRAAADSGEPWVKLQLEYYVRLLTTAVNSRHTSKLDLLERQLISQISAEVEAGTSRSKRTRFQIFAGENTDELLRISDLNKYHRAVFVEGDREDGHEEP